MTTDFKIRELTYLDREIFGDLIVKLVEKTDNKTLINMIPNPPSLDSEKESKSDEAKQMADTLSFAFSLLEGFMQFVKDDVLVWFMDLVGETDKSKLPFEFEMIVAEQLIESKGFINFFGMGSQVFKKIKGLANRLKK